LKSLANTRWKIEQERITIYPYGLSYILAAVLAVIFAAGYFYYVQYLQNSADTSITLLLVLIAVIICFVAWAGTCIEFDLTAGKMRKKLFGFLPIINIPFSEIYGITPVTNIAGTYNYKVFKKNNRYGKGIQLSSQYGKKNEHYAIAFVEEVINPIHRNLEAHDGPEDFKPIAINSYQFFDAQGGTYTIKKNKIGSIILGVILLSFGIHELTPAAWLDQDLSIGRICLLLFTILGGPAIILAGFTTVTLDKNSRLLSRSNPLGLGNKTFSFDDFNGIQTVRKSMNFIYSGTDVQVYFLKAGAQKEDVIVLQNFFSTKKVERFIAEVNSIITM